MATPIKMPKLGMTMAEGTVVEWPVALGDPVEKGQICLIIESEKAEVEIEATASGYFRHIYVEVEETVPCGTLLAALTDAPDDAFDADAFRAEHDTPMTASAAAAVTQPPAAPLPEPDTSTRSTRRKPVAPAARALAKKLGIDIEPIAGTGPGGRVTKADVEKWAEAAATLVEVAQGVRLEVPSTGSGPTVVLLPGFGTDASVFAQQVPALAERFRVRGVNPRGVGMSDAPDAASYDPSLLACDAAALIEDEPAHIVGASMGAAVALEMSLAHPERVRSMTLITPAVDIMPRLGAVLEVWCRLSASVSADTLALTLLPWLVSNSLLGDQRAADRMRRGLAGVLSRVPATVLERYAAGLRAWSGSVRERLSAVETPTLVIAGRDDLLTPHGEAIARAIPNARYVEIPDAGHAVSLEAPQAVTEAILEHLSAHGTA